MAKNKNLSTIEKNWLYSSLMQISLLETFLKNKLLNQLRI